MHARKLLIAVCLTFASVALAQGPAYDAITIKPTQSAESVDTNGIVHSSTRFMTSAAAFSATNIKIRSLIANAYNVKEDDVLGMPDSLTSGYDVEAKMDGATVAALAKLPPDQRAEQRRLMLQSLLADRFHLKVHSETKEAPIFALVIAKGGSRLQPADPAKPSTLKGPDGNPMPAGAMHVMPAQFTGPAIPLKAFANFLAGQLHRPVDDRTGLAGNYEINLHWTPEEGSPMRSAGELPGMPAIDPNGPSLTTAVEEQLGLKLESTKGPIETIVVDHIERPTEN